MFDSHLRLTCTVANARMDVVNVGDAWSGFLRFMIELPWR